MNSNRASNSPFRVLIAGGGVAALEVALALRELAGDRVQTTLLAPNSEFVYRPMAVREPFGYTTARRYELAEIARDVGAELCVDSFKWLEPEARRVHTDGGGTLGYDALVLALGARRYDRYPHALTLDDARLDEQLHGLIQDIEGGYTHSVAFVAPSRMPWPLPIYELALMTASRAHDTNARVSVTIATPEDAPLAIFGSKVSDEVQLMLEEHGILTLTSAHCEVPASGRVVIHPGSRELHVDRVVALPELCGPAVPGVPKDAEGGFIPVDVEYRVRGLERVYAVGDAADFPIKHGGMAAQQADTAAESIAALAGVAIKPAPFNPVIRGILLSAERPVYMTAHIAGGHGTASEISVEPLWSPAAKIAAKYLAPYLNAKNRVRLVSPEYPVPAPSQMR
jgi:sulfide:quinone oxidoreductase